MKKEYVFLIVAFVAMIVGACTCIVQVQTDNVNSTQQNTSSSTNSADSANVDLDLP